MLYRRSKHSQGHTFQDYYHGLLGSRDDAAATVTGAAAQLANQATADAGSPADMIDGVALSVPLFLARGLTLSRGD